MSSSNGGNGGSDDKNHRNKNKNKGKSSSSPITSDQEASMEIVFDAIPHPNKLQQDELAKCLGLQPEQVAEWFHQKRAQKQYHPPLYPPHYHGVPSSSAGSPSPSVDSDEADFLMEKSRMLQIAKTASEELGKLLQVNEPVWVQSSRDGRLVLDHQKYQTMFPRNSDPNVFKTPNTREESSIASMTVYMTAKKMVEALLDPKEMAELFPTMIRRAEIIKEYEHGADETKHGALVLMYLEIHHLSHLVPTRKYFFLRYCEKVHDSGIWMISDVSLNSLGTNLPQLPCWKHPSGCVIHQMADQNGRSNILVKWVEHVEVSDRPEASLIYGDLVANNIPYSADRWIMILHRNAEKLCFCQSSPNEDMKVFTTSHLIPIEGRRSLLHITHGMLQKFCETLNISCKPEITHLFESSNNNGAIKYSLRKNTAPGHPIGVIATLVTSFWIPLNYHHVFCFLTDPTKRNLWDPLCVGHAPFEVLLMGTGHYIGNRVSVIRRNVPLFWDLKEPCDPQQKEVLILQESSIDNFTGHIVYSAVERNIIQQIMVGRGFGSSQLCVLPSGFVLTADANAASDLLKRGLPHEQQKGTLVTMGYQALVATTPSTKELKMKDLEVTNDVFRMMVNNIKLALGCPDLG